MNRSFFTAAIGVGGQQAKMDVIANNIANINTAGYKAKTGIFADLMHYETHNGNDGNPTSGSGIALNRVTTDFTPNGSQETGGEHDYAIEGEGFFMLADPVTGDISYTRNGQFSLSRAGDLLYLVNDAGKRVMNMNGQPITYPAAVEVEEEDTEQAEEELTAEMLEERRREGVGVYTFAIKNGMQSIGNNEFVPVEKNGQPMLIEYPDLKKGALEPSGTNLATEMSRVVEASRAYSYAMRMLQTSDEIENSFNNLR